MENNAVAIRSKVRTAYEAILEKKKALKNITDARMKTNGKFRWTFNLNSPSIDIFRETNISTLLSILAFLINKVDNYEKAIKLVDLNNAPIFDWLGYSFDDWKNDIKTRIAVLNHSALLNTLNDAEKELAKYFSEEDNIALTLEKITKNLNLDI